MTEPKQSYAVKKNIARFIPPININVRQKYFIQECVKIITMKWNRPELVVIGRGNVEEAVLDSCKWTSGGNGAGSTQGNDCLTGIDQHQCNALGSS